MARQIFSSNLLVWWQLYEQEGQPFNRELMEGEIDMAMQRFDDNGGEGGFYLSLK